MRRLAFRAEVQLDIGLRKMGTENELDRLIDDYIAAFGEQYLRRPQPKISDEDKQAIVALLRRALERDVPATGTEWGRMRGLVIETTDEGKSPR